MRSFGRSLPFMCFLAVGLLAGPAVAGLNPAVVALGEALYMDEDLSLNRNQSCNSCHDAGLTAPPTVTGFVDPANVNTGSPVSAGSVDGLFGGRNAPAAGYAAFSPFFRWDEVAGLYVGGQFWDGRENTLAGQAAGPFLNPVEMAMPDKWAVVDRLRASTDPYYVTLFNDAYPDENLGDILFSIPSRADATVLDPQPPGVLEIYDRMAQAIGEFEKSRWFNKFNSRYDYYLAGDRGALTPQEHKGLKLFEGKGKCALCHLSQPALAPDGTPLPPLFTDFTYDNLGIPVNPAIAALMGEPSLPIDYGLGGRADIAERDPVTGPDGTTVSAGQAGKFKVMSLRNIELTAPYGHNGFFATLADIVHFYNTRDVDPVWPPPEVALNVNAAELGDLKLTPEQEADIVAFLLTLTDRDPVAFPSPYFANYGDAPPIVTPIPMP